jgi:predicted TIM-barrel fold metal-dependent hydrolase
VPAFDLHQHLWPPLLIRALEGRAEVPRLRGRVLELPSGSWTVDLTTHDLDVRLAALDRNEIDVAVISLAPTLQLGADLVDAYHEDILEVVAASNGRLRALASDSVRDGFVGACVAATRFDDLDALAPLFAELQHSDQFLFVHPGPALTPAHAPDWWASVVGYTAQMQSAYAAWLAAGADAWPGMRVLFAILAGGAPIQLERLASRGIDTRAVLHENVFLETASYGERSLELALATYGVGQIVYGSDWPVIDVEPTLRSVRGFGQAVTDAVCRDTPARLLA